MIVDIKIVSKGNNGIVADDIPNNFDYYNKIIIFDCSLGNNNICELFFVNDYKLDDPDDFIYF